MKTNTIETLETIGTFCGIVGAILLATKFGEYGYPFFLASSLFLTITAIQLKQRKFIALQGVFFVINAIGLFNYI